MMKTLIRLSKACGGLRSGMRYIYEAPYREVRTVLFRPLLVNVYARLGRDTIREAIDL